MDYDERMNTIEAQQEKQGERLRTVETGLAALGSLPEKLEKISDQLGDLIRADVRIKHLEEKQTKMEDEVDSLKVRLAKWVGGLGALGAAAQYFLGG